MTLDLITDQDFIDFCTREYGWKIEGPSHTAVPEPKSEYVTGNAREVELVRHYLTQTYLIKDQFDSDHAARRIFFDEVIRSEPAVAMWVKNHSKLKGNRVTTEVYYPMVLITENLQEHFPQKGRSLNEIHQSHQFLIGPQYDVLSFEEKIAYVRKVDDVAYRFLEELAK